MLGQVLVKEFREANYEVIDWDKDDVDITDKNQLESKLVDLRPGIIINAAAYNNVDKIETENREAAFKINGEAVGNLAELCKLLNTIFVHYSTDYVFKGDKVNGYAEDDQPEPINVYGESKFRGEKDIFKISGLKYYLIRTSHLFGLPAMSEVAKKSFVDVILETGKTKGEIDLVTEGVFSPTYVPDLAQSTRELVETGLAWGVYHRTNNGSCTWYGWGKKIFEIMNLPVKINPVTSDKFPRPAKRPLFSVLKTTKLPPLRDWEEATKEYLYNAVVS